VILLPRFFRDEQTGRGERNRAFSKLIAQVSRNEDGRRKYETQGEIDLPGEKKGRKNGGD